MEGTELWIFTTSLFFPIFACELVVNPDEEEAGLSTEYLLSNAEVVRQDQQEGSCPEVPDEIRVLRYFVQVSPDRRQERTVQVLVNLGRVIEHNYSWSEESWLPRRQRIV